MSQEQSEALLRCSAIPINDEHRYNSQVARSPSAPAAQLGSEPATKKRGNQEMHTEFSSETHHSLNSYNDHNTRDTDDGDPRPPKRRKPRSAPDVTSHLHLRRSTLLGSPSTTRPKINDAQPQIDCRGPSLFLDDSNYPTSQTSRSSFVAAAAEAKSAANYQEWPFQGFFKRTRIGDNVIYSLEFKLSSISKQLYIPIEPRALDICSSKAAPAEVPIHDDVAVYSKIY